MLEIPSKKHKNVTFVLAAEQTGNVYLLAITLGTKKRIVEVDHKQVSSSSSKIMLLEGFITQMSTAPCVPGRRNRSTSACTMRRAS